jgi:acyl-CoA hydrolase
LKSGKYKHPSESAVIKTEVVCPVDTNPMGLLKGGKLVEWMDMAAAGCAQIHTGKICVTAGIHHVDFNEAAKTGDIISIKARVTRVFKTSMEIFVQAYARNIRQRDKELISEAYFTFVALDEEGKATPAVAVRPVTVMEKKLFVTAGVRKRNAGNRKQKPGRYL